MQLSFTTFTRELRAIVKYLNINTSKVLVKLTFSTFVENNMKINIKKKSYLT